MKKVLLIVVDACASNVLISAMRAGKLPNLQILAEAGSLSPECVSVFPSITPAATASIVTGQYPGGHNILGAHWYNLEENEVIYYGDDFWVILSQGFGHFFEGLLVKLNYQWLQAETLFQRVERSGFKAACLNYLIFRGDVKHTANVPFLLSLLPGVPFKEEIYGPSILYFGDLVDAEVELRGPSPRVKSGLFHRFGFEDDNTAEYLIHLAMNGPMPDFTLAYFPDNDFHSHEVGPEAAVTTLEHLDTKIGDLLAAYGGLEPLLQELCLVLTGDHSQSDILADEEVASIQLNQVLTDFSIAEAGEPWTDEDQLVIGLNMRTAQIYFHHPDLAQLNRAVEQLLAEPRIDQVIYRAKVLAEGEKGYGVATRDRGRLHFWPGADGPDTALDPYGCAWSWTGNLSAVDGQVSPDRILTFPTYPNAFERIAGGLDYKYCGHLSVTAQPGYEFRLPLTNIHPGGGSHGSLHALDSLSPLLVAGLPEGIVAPSHPRIVDVTPLCLAVLGLEPPSPIGASLINSRHKFMFVNIREAG